MQTGQVGLCSRLSIQSIRVQSAQGVNQAPAAGFYVDSRAGIRVLLLGHHGPVSPLVGRGDPVVLDIIWPQGDRVQRSARHASCLPTGREH